MNMPVTGTPLPAYRYRAEVLRVIDGDTLEVEVDLGFYTKVRTRLRLYGINCPELSGPGYAGVEAKHFAASRLLGPVPPTGPRTFVPVTCDVIKADKYGNRWDAVVWVGAESLADLLVAAGHARKVSYGEQNTGVTCEV